MARINQSDLTELIRRCAALSPEILGYRAEGSAATVLDAGPGVDDSIAVNFIRQVVDRYRLMLIPSVVAILDSTPILVPPLRQWLFAGSRPTFDALCSMQE